MKKKTLTAKRFDNNFFGKECLNANVNLFQRDDVIRHRPLIRKCNPIRLKRIEFEEFQQKKRLIEDSFRKRLKFEVRVSLDFEEKR